MTPAWRKMSFDDAMCCIEARETAGEIRAQVSKFPESISQIVETLLDRLPLTSKTPLIIRKNKRADISIATQTLLLFISSNLKSLVSSKANLNLLDKSFHRIAFGLVQLLEDGASTVQ
jgi:hypothetical protein